MTLRHFMEKLRIWARLYGKPRAGTPHSEPERDPLLTLVGSGKELWHDEHADEYVRRLREENPPPRDEQETER